MKISHFDKYGQTVITFNPENMYHVSDASQSILIACEENKWGEGATDGFIFPVDKAQDNAISSYSIQISRSTNLFVFKFKDLSTDTWCEYEGLYRNLYAGLEKYFIDNYVGSFDVAYPFDNNVPH